MRNPHRWRAIGIVVVASGAVSVIPVFVLSKPAVDHWAVGLAFGYGMMAIIFGTLWTL